ncbi:MAG: hypothetical protein RBS17_01445 [Coriobacteriia bacterium]|nr:hypothetical protein [Coriobacteriia bacterium]
MSVGVTERGMLKLRAVVFRAAVLRERGVDARVPVERDAGALPRRECDVAAPVLRARFDAARLPDPDRTEVDLLLVDTRFCFCAAAMACNPWCDKADDGPA